MSFPISSPSVYASGAPGDQLRVYQGGCVYEGCMWQSYLLSIYWLCMLSEDYKDYKGYDMIEIRERFEKTYMSIYRDMELHGHMEYSKYSYI